MRRSTRLKINYCVLLLIGFIAVAGSAPHLLVLSYKFVQHADRMTSDLLIKTIWLNSLCLLLFGVILIGSCLSGLKKLRKKEGLRLMYPSEPWRWDGRYSSSEPKDTGKTRSIGLVVCALCMLFLTIPFRYDRPSLDFLWLIPLLAVLGITSIRMLPSHKRTRRFRLKLMTMPGIIGGHLRGAVILPEKFPAESCLRFL